MLAFTSELRKWIIVCWWRHARTRRPCWRQWRCRAVSRPPHRRSSWDWTRWPRCCLTRVCTPRACQPHGLRNNTNTLQSKSSLWKAFYHQSSTNSCNPQHAQTSGDSFAPADCRCGPGILRHEGDNKCRHQTLTPPYSSHCAQASSQVFFVSEKRYLCRGWNTWNIFLCIFMIIYIFLGRYFRMILQSKVPWNKY